MCRLTAPALPQIRLEDVYDGRDNGRVRWGVVPQVHCQKVFKGETVLLEERRLHSLVCG